MRSRLITCCLLACLAFYVGQTMPACAAPDPLMTPWLSDAAQQRESLLADLKIQISRQTSAPPWDHILLLLTQAQGELQKPALADKRDAIDKAYQAALITQTQTDDDTVAARIFDGFLLPTLRFALPGPAYQTSRQSLLRSAFIVYQATNQEDKVKAVLLLLQEGPLNQNTQDWTKVQLGAVYANDQQYGKAIAVLKTVQSPGMKGSVAFLPALRRKMNEVNPGSAGRHSARNKHAKSAARRKARTHATP